MALPDKLTDNLNELSSLWLAAKEAEKEATDDRRKIEDRIKSLVGFAENSEGTETAEPDQFTIKIVGRIDRKVDGDKVQELAAEFGLTRQRTSWPWFRSCPTRCVPMNPVAPVTNTV